MTAVTLCEIPWKDLGASVVSSCPSEMPPQQEEQVELQLQQVHSIREGEFIMEKLFDFWRFWFGFFSSEMDSPLETCTNCPLAFPPGKMES